MEDIFLDIGIKSVILSDEGFTKHKNTPKEVLQSHMLKLSNIQYAKELLNYMFSQKFTLFYEWKQQNFSKIKCNPRMFLTIFYIYHYPDGLDELRTHQKDTLNTYHRSRILDNVHYFVNMYHHILDRFMHPNTLSQHIQYYENNREEFEQSLITLFSNYMTIDTYINYYRTGQSITHHDGHSNQNQNVWIKTKEYWDRFYATLKPFQSHNIKFVLYYILNELTEKISTYNSNKVLSLEELMEPKMWIEQWKTQIDYTKMRKMFVQIQNIIYQCDKSHIQELNEWKRQWIELDKVLSNLSTEKRRRIMPDVWTDFFEVACQYVSQME